MCSMNKLFQFIINFLSALFDEYGFIITSSKNSGNDFHGASIIMSSSDLEIFLAIERDEITAQFRSLYDNRKNNWYSAEIVLTLLGNKGCIGVLDIRMANLLKIELPAIIDNFQKTEVERTIKCLEEIEKNRGK